MDKSGSVAPKVHVPSASLPAARRLLRREERGQKLIEIANLLAVGLVC